MPQPRPDAAKSINKKQKMLTEHRFTKLVGTAALGMEQDRTTLNGFDYVAVIVIVDVIVCPSGTKLLTLDCGD